MKKAEDKKVFVIVNSYFIGDILLTNPLIQNIKKLYPDSIVVMVTSEKLQETARYQIGVDDVVIWDRKGKDKGFIGMLKFLLRFPYKKVYAAFPIYGMDRPTLLCKMLNPKYILAPKRKGLISYLIKSKFPIRYSGYSTQTSIISLLTGITEKELQNFPMRYEVPENCPKPDIENPYIVLCPTSTRKSKDIPSEIVSEIVEKLDYNIVLVGQGNSASECSETLRNKNYKNLTDLTNKTSILEAANIIKHAKGMIAVDTGLMHMACAVKTPTVAVFYETTTKHYIPDEKLYNVKVVNENQTSENILKSLKTILGI